MSYTDDDRIPGDRIADLTHEPPHDRTRGDARIPTERLDLGSTGRTYVEDDVVDSIRVESERSGVRAEPREHVRHDTRQDVPSAMDDDEPEIIERLREPGNRARLQLATAMIAAATLVLVLIGLIVTLTQGPDDPVIVDGVPCLVQDGEDGQALLFCQR